MKKVDKRIQGYWPINTILMCAILFSALLSVTMLILVFLETEFAVLLTVGISNTILAISIVVGVKLFFVDSLRRIGTGIRKIANAPKIETDNIPGYVFELSYIEKNVNDINDSIIERLKPSVEQEKRRKILLASICHDLRTPLTSLMGHIEALEDNVGDRATSLHIMYERANFINKLIDDLDVYAKNDLDQLEIYPKKVLADELILSCVHGIRDSKILIVDPIVRAYVFADPYRMTQVLENVINNSRKYAKSTIVIETAIDESYYAIKISDDGDGIAEQYRDKIFDPFFMVQKNSNGTGLGLAISQNLMKAHGGSIELMQESKLGGADFLIKFPIA
ncbi:MAG: HAMP domain-containing sensor histidine kinase [Bacillota bacterium]|nr:HAMP domain-containing sensor histidine kinase [Bacillota bacterium]